MQVLFWTHTNKRNGINDAFARVCSDGRAFSRAQKRADEMYDGVPSLLVIARFLTTFLPYRSSSCLRSRQKRQTVSAISNGLEYVQSENVCGRWHSIIIFMRLAYPLPVHGRRGLDGFLRSSWSMSIRGCIHLVDNGRLCLLDFHDFGLVLVLQLALQVELSVLRERVRRSRSVLCERTFFC